MVRETELSLLELDLIGEALGLDVRPFPFEFPSHGDLLEDRARLAEVVHGTLGGKGLIEGARFVPELERQIRAFARGRVSVVLVGTAGSRSLLARMSGDDRFAVLAEQRSQMMRFESVNPDNPVRAIVGLVPPMKPASGRSLTITRPAPVTTRPRHRRDDEDEVFNQGVLQPVRTVQGPSAASQSAVAEIMRRPRMGSGYFTVSVRQRNGREGEPLTVSWLDTDAGRYVAIPDARPDGSLDVTYTPGDLQLLDQIVNRHMLTLTQ
ncbi:MAG TPA: ESX secretion-associated protein EspG [Pseudonocardiaceae bacterium]|jgi:hypothetical protein|nr:ESX secretion-associated protein EspG [Pseudonocardiaceae bacterium]